jgi:hypothetical protein
MIFLCVSDLDFLETNGVESNYHTRGLGKFKVASREKEERLPITDATIQP